jgi:hypothetical protein
VRTVKARIYDTGAIIDICSGIEVVCPSVNAAWSDRDTSSIDVVHWNICIWVKVEHTSLRTACHSYLTRLDAISHVTIGTRTRGIAKRLGITHCNVGQARIDLVASRITRTRVKARPVVYCRVFEVVMCRYVHAAKYDWLASLVISCCVLVEVAGKLVSASQHMSSDVAKLATWGADHAGAVILRSRTIVVQSARVHASLNIRHAAVSHNRTPLTIQPRVSKAASRVLWFWVS